MLPCQKKLFTLDPSVHYLNCGYMSPMLKSVEQKGIEGVMAKRNPFHISADDFFADSEELRKEFAKLIGSDQSDRIAILPSASYGISTVANNIRFKKGDEIILLEGQFPSNYYIWERKAKEFGAVIKSIAQPESTTPGKNWNADILAAITSKTKLVALGHVHWADGTLFNLREIRAKTREVGALLVVDGTQSVGALPFYIDEIQPDALICAGYKWLMGPYSIALGYFGPLFDQGIPLEENWINRKDSQNFSGLVNYQSEYQPGALRYEVGEHSNFILVPMMLEALKQINSWGVENIQEYCSSLVQDSLSTLRDSRYQIEEQNFRSSHLFGIRRHDFDPQVFSNELSKNHIYVSVRGNALRVSVNVFNERADMEALKKVCLRLVR